MHFHNIEKIIFLIQPHKNQIKLYKLIMIWIHMSLKYCANILKVSKSQKQFFWKIYSPKKQREVFEGFLPLPLICLVKISLNYAMNRLSDQITIVRKSFTLPRGICEFHFNNGVHGRAIFIVKWGKNLLSVMGFKNAS